MQKVFVQWKTIFESLKEVHLTEINCGLLVNSVSGDSDFLLTKKRNKLYICIHKCDDVN